VTWKSRASLRNACLGILSFGVRLLCDSKYLDCTNTTDCLLQQFNRASDLVNLMMRANVLQVFRAV